MKRASLIAAVSFCLTFVTGPPSWDFEASAAELVSVNDSGTDSGNGRSSMSFIHTNLSADGTKIAFWSFASDLGPNDTNGFADVYVRDLSAGTTTLVSVNDLGTSGNGDSSNAVISADGTKVAFSSRAGDLGPNDTNGFTDIYVRDLTGGPTTLVSVNDLGANGGNGSSSNAVISAEGTKVAFLSDATDLGPTDTNGLRDVYVASFGGPIELIANLIAFVVDLNLSKGITNSLDAKLDAVEKALADANASNDVAAINALGAFIAAVEAQRAKKEITDAEADALVAAAEQIIDLLSV